MNSLIKVWEIPGGVHPPENKVQSLQLPLGKLPLPPQLTLPLNQHIGNPAKPVVSVGERVRAGQIIAEADGIFSANVHASSSGIVSAIEDRMIPHPSGMSAPCIVIDTDGQHEWVTLNPAVDYSSLSKSELLDKIRSAGVAGLGGAGFPTSVKLNPRANHRIDTLIINGTECEPYITADDTLMQTRAEDVIAGTLLLAKLLNHPERLVIGVEDNKPQAIATLRAAAADTQVEVVSFPTKYPSGGEKQLIQILTGREVPSGQIPASIGVVCQNVGTAVAAWRAVRYGEPLISRITTVVGEALEVQRNIDVLLGTPIDYVLEQHGFDASKASRLIMGGPMMGFTLPDSQVPVIKTTNCILAPSKTELPPPLPAQACIRCGMCAEACPASLLPQQLFWYAQADDQEKLQAHNLFDCIECGACSYVCPSNIPLVQYYRAAKGTIRQHELDKNKSDRARRRFEFRQQRIEKEEAEKEAKRLARKQAAEEARRKLAEKGPEDKPTSAASELVAGATAQAQASRQSPAEHQAKLERLLAAAQSSLDKAQQPLQPNEAGIEITPEQLDKQQARIKQAELKVREAEKKLADFAAKPDTATTQQESDDPVAAAIAQARAKLAMAPDEKLRANLESLQSRLEKAEQKVAEAKAEGNPNTEALQQGADKLRQKIANTRAELASLTPSTVAEPTPQSRGGGDAAGEAIEKAKAKAIAMASMSQEDKRRNQIESLNARLEKARERLARAEVEDDENLGAFRAGVTKLEEKLQQLTQD